MTRESEQEYRKALRAGLKALSARSRTRHECSTLLFKKGFHEDIISRVISHLQRCHYIDDRKFALHYAISKAKKRLWGELRIRQELRKKGVSEEDIQKAFQEAKGEIDEGEILEKAVRKKWQMLRITSQEKKISRLYDFLTRKGFSQEDIRNKMKSLTGEINDDFI